MLFTCQKTYEFVYFQPVFSPPTVSAVSFVLFLMRHCVQQWWERNILCQVAFRLFCELMLLRVFYYTYMFCCKNQFCHPVFLYSVLRISRLWNFRLFFLLVYDDHRHDTLLSRKHFYRSSKLASDNDVLYISYVWKVGLWLFYLKLQGAFHFWRSQ